MLSLCTLKRTLFTVLSSAAAYGSISQTLLVQVQTDSRQGPLDTADLGRVYKTNQLAEELRYRVDGVWDTVAINASVVTVQPDYSSILVRTKDGTEEPLSNRGIPTNEISSDVGLGWARSQNAAFMGWRGTLTDSPFASHLVRGSFERSILSQTTILGINGAYLSQKQPESFYIDQDFKTKQRPTQVNAYEVVLTYDQILSESWKMRNSISLSQRIEERPRNISFKSKQGYALTETLFADLEFTLAEEIRSESLKNERGYFRAYGTRIGLTAELSYEFLVSISYGLAIEQEDRSDRSLRTEVASDQYGIGISYRFLGADLELRGGYAATNTQINGLSFSGGALWQL